MKTISYTLISLLGLLGSLPLSAEVLFSEDFESGQTVGNQPSGSAIIAPGSNTATNSVQIVAGSGNSAGGGAGNGVALYNDTSPTEETALEYNFVSGAGAQQSVFRFDVDFARLEDRSEATNTRFSIVLGAYNASTSPVFNNTNNYFSEIRLRNNGLVGIVGNGTSGPNSFDYIAGLGERVRLTMVVNDLDSQSIDYINPLTGATESLNANSIAYFLDGDDAHDYSFTTLLDLSASSIGGTVADTESNFGRLGIYSSGGVDLNYNFDNFLVTTTVPEPGNAGLLLGLGALGILLHRRHRA